MIDILVMLWVPEVFGVVVLVCLVVSIRRKRRNSGVIWHDPEAYPRILNPWAEETQDMHARSVTFREAHIRDGRILPPSP
jgi:hypothetical protein